MAGWQAGKLISKLAVKYVKVRVLVCSAAGWLANRPAAGWARQLLGRWAGWLASWLVVNAKVGAFPQRASAETVACA